MITNATETTDWMKLAQSVLESPDNSSRYNWQFPMGVFGTLRERCGNNPLMHRNGKPFKIARAFLPHFDATGLSIRHVPNASCPFEVFYYEPDEWDKMINSVDRLEGFHPKSHDQRADGSGYREWGYYRTLAVLRLLPEEFEHRFFPKDREPDIWSERSLGIAPEEFANFTPVPAWVYSSMRMNRACAAAPQLPANPILWPSK